MHTTIKTTLDYLISLFGIFIFAPFILIYSLYLIIYHNTSPIIVQNRGVGFENGRIKIFKLRTIKKESEIFYEKGKTLRKVTTSDQFLPMGRFLRKAGIDEIPQLLNVLSGKMSLIGPRPLMNEDLERMKEFNHEFTQLRNSLISKPGISGLWQLERSAELSFQELIRLDLEYESLKNIGLEIQLLFRTVIKILKRDHSDSIEQNETKIFSSNIIEDIQECSLKY